MSNFQLLEVVDRCSETQPQAVKNLNKLTGLGLNVRRDVRVNTLFCMLTYLWESTAGKTFTPAAFMLCQLSNQIQSMMTSKYLISPNYCYLI